MLPGFGSEHRLSAPVLERQRGIEQQAVCGEESIEVLDLRAVRDSMRDQSHPEASHRVVVTRGVMMHRRKVLDSLYDPRLGLYQAISTHREASRRWSR